jgi:hypothetical protein
MSTSILEQQRAAEALRQSTIPAIRNLSIEETDEFVLIHGNVVSYYLKQLAQETVMPVLEGRELRNRVTVQSARPEPNN